MGSNPVQALIFSGCSFINCLLFIISWYLKLRRPSSLLKDICCTCHSLSVGRYQFFKSIRKEYDTGYWYQYRCYDVTMKSHTMTSSIEVENAHKIWHDNHDNNTVLRNSTSRTFHDRRCKQSFIFRMFEFAHRVFTQCTVDCCSWQKSLRVLLTVRVLRIVWHVQANITISTNHMGEKKSIVFSRSWLFRPNVFEFQLYIKLFSKLTEYVARPLT